MGRFNPTLQIFRFSSLEKRKDFGSASQAWCSRNSFQLLIMFSFLYVDFCRFAAELKKKNPVTFSLLVTEKEDIKNEEDVPLRTKVRKLFS